MSKSWFLISLVCLLANGEVEARKGFGTGDQEWGYVTVRPKAHMFWWLYFVNPPIQPPQNFSVYEKPLLIWLQGGPGGSSTGYGNFEELGPLDLELNPRNYTWVKDYNVLFIDNPVGTGFSYSESYSGYTKTNRQISEDLVECIRKFLHDIPGFADVPTYITSESYGGKMAAEFGLLWFKEQSEKRIKSNLKGVALGDSWISPIDSVLSWAPFLLETGMVDYNGYEKIKDAASATELAVQQRRWAAATELWGATENVILEVTNNIDFYNILEEKNPRRVFRRSLSRNNSRVDRDDVLNDLMNTKVKEALQLENTWGAQQYRVFEILSGDFMKPATDIVERLLNETSLEVFVFTGQLDLIVATPGTLAWVEKLKWKSAAEWQAAKRKTLVVDNIIEGYVKEYNKFKMYWISRSGHMVPRDNPWATGAMLKHLTST